MMESLDDWLVMNMNMQDEGSNIVLVAGIRFIALFG